MHATRERLLRSERMSDKPQCSSDFFVQQNVGEQGKGVNPFMEEAQQGHNSPDSLSELFSQEKQKPVAAEEFYLSR